MKIDERCLDKFQQMRRERIRLVEEELREKKEVGLGRFRAEMGIKYGIRPSTLFEYLDSLEEMGCIRIEGRLIRYLGDSKTAEKKGGE